MTLSKRKILVGITISLCSAGTIHPTFADPVTTTSEQVGESKPKHDKWTLFNSPEKGFKLKYPSDWAEEEFQQGPLVCKFKTLNGLVSARMAVEQLPPGMTLDQYSTATNQQVKAFMESEKMPVTIVEESRTVFNTVPACKIVYTFPLADKPATTKAMQILAVKNGRGYVFNYTAISDKYDEFLTVINTVVNSIELL